MSFTSANATRAKTDEAKAFIAARKIADMAKTVGDLIAKNAADGIGYVELQTDITAEFPTIVSDLQEAGYTIERKSVYTTIIGW